MQFRIVISLLFFALTLLRAAPVFETLADFERAGTNPSARLVAHPDGNYYGTTLDGGVFNFGTVYKMTPGGTVTTLVSFTGEDGVVRGSYPAAGLTLGGDGSLFGTTGNGGAGDYGTIFKVTTAGVFTSLVEYTGMTGAKKGSVPNGLVLHPDGFFYGTTQAGGAGDFGTVFKVDAAGNLTTIAELTGTVAPQKGTAPTGRLAVSGTTLYGAAQAGGANDCGTVFSVTTNGVSWVMLAELTGTSGQKRGSGPLGGVTLVGATLFGTTEAGGLLDSGTIFRLPTNATNFATIRDFGGPDGSAPAAQLLASADGFLYGSTMSGGAEDEGTLFKVSSGYPYTYSLVATFSGGSGSVPGSGPRGALIVGHDGQFFGTTEAGGPAGNGTVFKVTSLGAVTSLACFTNATGWNPTGAPLHTTSGVIFPNHSGGAAGRGTLIRLPLTGAPFIDSDFPESVGEPAGSVIDVSGARFGLSETRRLFTLSDSSSPLALATVSSAIGSDAEELADGHDGYLYGASTTGGSSMKGTVFRLTPSGSATLMATFTGANGQSPNAPLAFGTDGIFGTTEKGGASNNGTIFKVATGGGLTTLLSFGATGPRRPTAGLVAGVDGNFYGTTALGGASDRGVVFRVTPAGVFTVVREFTGSDGNQPCRLLAAADGTLYGCALEGGAGSSGTVFRVRPDGTFTSLFSLTGYSGLIRGKGPEGKLGFGPGGILYGVASKGGTGGGGTAFRITGTGPHGGTRPAVRAVQNFVELHSLVQLGGENTNVSFDFGPTIALGQNTGSALLAPTALAHETFIDVVTPPAPGQSLFFRVRAVNASGTSLGPILTYTSPTLFEQWKIDNLGDPNAPDLGDPDGDGLATLMEYALALNPLETSAGPAPQRVSFSEGPRLTLSVNRDPTHSDATIEVLAGPGVVGPWTVVASSTNGAPFSGPGYVSGEVAGTAVRAVTIKDSAATTGAGQRFMRVRVVH